MGKYTVEEIRNLAVVGHGASGKTSLTDALLYKAGAVDRLGSVDDGTSVSDFDDQEKEHKFSIDTSFVHFAYHGEQIHLLDTPGYPDFMGAALEALNVVETAVVVISAPNGIQPNTRRMFNEAGRLGLGRILVINKLDSDNVDFAALVDNIKESLGKHCVLFNVPVGAGHDFSGVVSVLNPPAEPPAGCLMDPRELHSELLDDIVESDEALMEKYLEQGEEKLSHEELLAAMPRALASGTIIPIFCTSAKKQVGIEELLEGISEFAMSPVQGPRRKARSGKSGEVQLEPNLDGECVGQVFKVVHDKFVGTLSYFRIFSGKMTSDQPIVNHRTGKSNRSGGLLLMQGKSQEHINEAIAGDIVAVAKVDDLHIGDTVGNNGNAMELPIPAVPHPMFGLAVEPKSRGDEQKISQSLTKMAEEDVTFKVTRDNQTKEMVIAGMSQLHLDVVQERLKRRYNLEVVTKEPKIPYRETITTNAEASYRHKKQSGGRGQFGEVHLRVYPLPREIHSSEQFFEEFANKSRFEKLRLDNSAYDPAYNFGFIDHIVGGSIPNQYIPAVLKGCRELLDRGALAGYRMQDLAVEVHFGKDHPVDSSEAAFKIAGMRALRDAFKLAHPVLLEPVVNMEVTIPSQYTGAILGDLNTKRARIEDQETLPGDLAVLKCKVPLAEVTRYAAQLGSITQGTGSYSMEFSHYDMVPPNVQQQIVARAQLKEDEEE